MQYIPQAPPFVMIDEIVNSTTTLTKTKFRIKENCVLVEDGDLSEAGLIENMAQTAAAGTGLRAVEAAQPAPVGFIGAIKDLRISELPKIGDEIESTITFITQVMNAHVVKGEVKLNDKIIATAEYKIFLQ